MKSSFVGDVGEEEFYLFVTIRCQRALTQTGTRYAAPNQWIILAEAGSECL
jgi:hypothetical protein